jgi:hypothetical protein
MDKPSGSNIIAKSQSAKAKIAKAFALEGSENHVCFTPKRGHSVVLIGCPLSANSGHLAIHSIISSATNCIEVETERPSALAVLRLMTSSNLANCTIGRSAGFSPFRIFPV